jgi:hypothetical protein
MRPQPRACKRLELGPVPLIPVIQFSSDCSISTAIRQKHAICTRVGPPTQWTAQCARVQLGSPSTAASVVAAAVVVVVEAVEAVEWGGVGWGGVGGGWGGGGVGWGMKHADGARTRSQSDQAAHARHKRPPLPSRTQWVQMATRASSRKMLSTRYEALIRCSQRAKILHTQHVPTAHTPKQAACASSIPTPIALHMNWQLCTHLPCAACATRCTRGVSCERGWPNEVSTWTPWPLE